MNSFTECGPCASHTACASCQEPYSEGELIIQCIQCERWLHGACDSVKTEADAEKCAEEGYNCVLCRWEIHSGFCLESFMIDDSVVVNSTKL